MVSKFLRNLSVFWNIFIVKVFEFLSGLILFVSLEIMIFGKFKFILLIFIVDRLLFGGGGVLGLKLYYL